MPANQAHTAQAARATSLLLQGPGNLPLYQQWMSKLALPTPRGSVTISRDNSLPSSVAGGGNGAGTYVDAQGQPHILLGVKTDYSAFAHEMGHVVDDKMLTDQARAKITHWLKRDGKQWGAAGDAIRSYQENGQESKPTRERFAEVYRILATHPQVTESKQAYSHYAHEAAFQYMNRLPGFFAMRKMQALLKTLS